MAKETAERRRAPLAQPAKARRTALAAGVLAAALGISGEGGKRGRPDDDLEPAELIEANDTQDDPRDERQRTREERRRQLEQAVRRLRARTEAEEEPTRSKLSATEVTDDDLIDFAEQRAHDNPRTSVADPRFLELMRTMHVDHDGTSYYLYSDSEALNALAQSRGVHLESLLVLEEGENPRGEPEFYLDLFIETPKGIVSVGRRVIVGTPDQIKLRIAEHASDELARLVINGFPE